MKCKKEHYDHMDNEIKKVLEQYPNVHNDYILKGFSNQRLNWDLLRSAGLLPFVCNCLYAYMNDDHIETALKRITGFK